MKNLIVVLALILAPMLGQAEIQIETLSQGKKNQFLDYNFGAVNLNWRVHADFTLTEKGPEASEIKRITIGGMGFDADTDCPVKLEPGKSCTLRAFFWPTFEGPAWGDLNIYLNDGAIYIRLFGNGVRY